MKKTVMTLCIVHPSTGARVLLGMKKRGFGAGRWNGFGGKVKAGEMVEEAARRELHEEAGITAGEMEYMGVLEFAFNDKPGEVLEMHIFKASGFDGEPCESDEMRPQWFGVNEVPFSEMWPDDPHWFPLFLAGKKFRGRFLFEGHDAILEMSLEEVEEI